MNFAQTSSKSWASIAKNAILGEVVGHTVAIGAVYVPHYFAPQFEQKMTNQVAKGLAWFKHTTPQAEAANAQIVKDDIFMQVAGLANFGTQLWRTRSGIPAHQRASLVQDLGQVVAGRIGGTALSLMGEYATRHYASGLTAQVEGTLSEGAERANSMFWHTPYHHPNREEKHFADVVFTNIVQTLFATPGNVAAQQLYRQVTGGGLGRAFS